MKSIDTSGDFGILRTLTSMFERDTPACILRLTHFSGIKQTIFKRAIKKFVLHFTIIILWGYIVIGEPIVFQ